METYQSVSCDLHSRLELAILRRRTLHLEWRTEAGTLMGAATQAGSGIAVDIYTREGAEWLEVDLTSGEHLCLRLDRLGEVGGI